MDTEHASPWIRAIENSIPEIVREHPILSKFQDRASIALHGSMAAGIADEFADIDLWFLLSETDLAELDRLSNSRFFSFELQGRKGHFNAEPVDQLRNEVSKCDLPLIYQFRKAIVIADPSDWANALVRLARQPMKREVRDAFFFYHYVEMRGEHRACDSPMNRREPLAVFFFVAKTIAQGLQAAIVLDGESYPYDKWLFAAAGETVTGRLALPFVQNIFDHLKSDALRFEGLEKENPITCELINIRRTLVQIAHDRGIDQPWLDRWWHYIPQARNAIRNVRW